MMYERYFVLSHSVVGKQLAYTKQLYHRILTCIHRNKLPQEVSN